MNAASWLENLPVQERWRSLLLKEGPRVATWALSLALGVQAALIVTDLAGAGRRASTTAAPVHAPGLRADVMRPQPVMDHGRMNGFRVYPGRDRMAFMRLGLRPGDQVTAINGTPLDDRDRGEQILHTLGSSTEAHVTVIRNGQQQDLVLNIAQVAQEADSLAAQEQQGAAAGVSPGGSAGTAFGPAPGTAPPPAPAGPEPVAEGRGQ